MRKEDKQLVIEQIGAQLKEYAHFYLVDVTGLNAAATSDLRRKCFGAEIKMVVVKNTLLHKAFEASEIDYSPLYGTLKGSTAIFFCNTANVPAKLIKEVGKDGIPGLKAAGITKKISFHCSRHTFGSLQVDAGTSVYTVQHMLGHKNVSTTQIYANMADESKRESVNRITLKPMKTVQLKVVGQ